MLPCCLFGLSRFLWFWCFGDGGRLVGLRLAGERSAWGGEFGDWHFGTTLCRQEVRVMVMVDLPNLKGRLGVRRAKGAGGRGRLEEGDI